MKYTQCMNIYLTMLSMIAFSFLVSANELRLTSEKWESSDSFPVSMKIKHLKANDPSNMLMCETPKSKYPGIMCKLNKADISKYSSIAFSIKINTPVTVCLQIKSRISGEKSKKYLFEFTASKGVSRKIFSLSGSSDKIDLNSVSEIRIYLNQPPPKTIFWIYDFVISDDSKCEAYQDKWEYNDGSMNDYLFNITVKDIINVSPPRDSILDNFLILGDIILWHSYKGTRKEILDFSGHGHLGEFCTADRITVDINNAGLRLHGKCGDIPQSYRIMESEKLLMDTGTICVWLWCDSKNKKDNTLIFSENNPKSNIVMKIKKNKISITSTITGSPVKAKSNIISAEWFHLAVAFDKKETKIYINGKITGEGKGGNIDGSAGFIIGKNIKNKNPFIGSIDDLKIYKHKMQTIEDSKNKPNIAYNPSGIVLKYDFQDSSKEPEKLEDISGNELHASIGGTITTGIQSKYKNTKPPNKKDSAWSIKTFSVSNGESPNYILLPQHPSLNMPRGTIIMYWRLDAMAVGGWPIKTLLTCYLPGGTRSTSDINIYSTHPNMHADMDPNKTPIFYRIGCGGRGMDKGFAPKMLYLDDWVKIVYTWDKTGSNLWINDEKSPLHGDKMVLNGEQGTIHIGYNNISASTSMTLSHFEIRSYKINIYCTNVTGSDEKEWDNQKPPEFKIKPRAEND